MEPFFSHEYADLPPLALCLFACSRTPWTLRAALMNQFVSLHPPAHHEDITAYLIRRCLCFYCHRRVCLFI